MARASSPPLPPSCARCGRDGPLIRAHGVRSELRAALDPALPHDAALCRTCLAEARASYFRAQLERERGVLSDIEREIAARASEHSLITTDVSRDLDRSATRGQRLADGVARVGGSWTFVLGFLLFLVIWMVVNGVFLSREAFDPYPFILLNLVLSCVAAIQAPIILMSQNRAGERDRRQATDDYRVNLKAELEVAALHEKLDLLLHTKWESLIELQEAQTELLEETIERLEALRARPSAEAGTERATSTSKPSTSDEP